MTEKPKLLVATDVMIEYLGDKVAGVKSVEK
jgi:hypothetical protein